MYSITHKCTKATQLFFITWLIVLLMIQLCAYRVVITFTPFVFAAIRVSVSVVPPQITVIDVPPSNNFTLTCTATSASATAATIVFTWSKQALGSTSSRELIHNDESVVIVTSGDLSTLTASETQSGGYVYTCSGRIGDGDASVDTATVNVRGILITIHKWHAHTLIVWVYSQKHQR